MHARSSPFATELHKNGKKHSADSAGIKGVNMDATALLADVLGDIEKSATGTGRASSRLPVTRHLSSNNFSSRTRQTLTPNKKGSHADQTAKQATSSAAGISYIKRKSDWKQKVRSGKAI